MLMREAIQAALTFAAGAPRADAIYPTTEVGERSLCPMQT